MQVSFNARIKAYQAYQQAESEVQKKQAVYDRLSSNQSKSAKPERLAAAQQEINEVRNHTELFFLFHC